MKTTYSRRSFIEKTGVLVGGVFLTQHIVAQTSQTLRIRKDVGTLDLNDPILASYRKAVQVMQGRQPSDPKSWTAQAQIHYDHCPHANWFFLPWHRAYLQHFEDLCREAAEDETFALPYWNWTKDPQIPKAFWQGVLNHGRTATATSTISPEFVGPTVIDGIMQLPDFETFASSKATQQREMAGEGELESNPHDNVHVFTGGDMVTYHSPLDPIFWLHHANIDRLWVNWIDHQHANTSDPVWTNFNFSANFVGRDGKPVDVSISQLYETEPLGYRYDDKAMVPTTTPHPGFAAVSSLVFAATNTKAAALKKPLAIQLAASQEFFQAAAAIASRPRVVRTSEIVKLAISDVKIENVPQAFMRVFINCDYLSVDTPLNDPHYVGTFGFFGMDHAEHAGQGRRYVFDITETLRKLARGKNLPKDQIHVQLLGVPLDGNKGLEVVPGKVEISVARAEIRD